MMNTSSNARYVIPVNSLMYRDVAAPLPVMKEARLEREAVAPGVPLEEVEARVAAARAEGVADAERRLAAEYCADVDDQAGKIAGAIEMFTGERRDYFARVESDVVHLAMAIAAKILHREAQVDPMLIAGLVRVAIDKLHDGSSVSVRVAPEGAEKWRAYLANPGKGTTVQIVEDDSLDAKDCVLETDLGSANFGVEAQLKEVEQGFFDLLARRPAIK
jgi:flagellar assembly protein FliH